MMGPDLPGSPTAGPLAQRADLAVATACLVMGAIGALEMRHMAVMRVRFGVLLKPFEDPAVGADARRREPRPHGSESGRELGIRAKNSRRAFKNEESQHVC